MRIYLDNCCFNRPYDFQNSETVRLETEAKLFVQESIRNKNIDLVWSFMLDYENGANPFEDQRESIAEWKALSISTVEKSEEIRELAKKFVSENGIGGKDALHLAAAISGDCRFLLSTDRQFLKRSHGIEGIETVNPIVFIAIMEGFYEK